MAGTGCRVLGTGLSDDILMDLGPFTFIVAPATEGQVSWLSSMLNMSDISMCHNTFEGKMIPHIIKKEKKKLYVLLN